MTSARRGADEVGSSDGRGGGRPLGEARGGGSKPGHLLKREQL